MNTQSITLSSNSSDYTQILDIIYLDDITEISISLLNVDESTPPTNLVIDWGDGTRETISAGGDVNTGDEKRDIIPSILSGKSSIFANKIFTHVLTPHETAKELISEIQLKMSFINGDRNYFRIPINMRTGGFLSTIEDYNISNVYEGLSATNYKLLTKKGYVLDFKK